MITAKPFRKERLLGTLLCAVPAIYCFSIAAYAVWQFDDFAGSLVYFTRYVAAPALIGGALVWMIFAGKAQTRTIVGVNAMAILAALFAHEAYATSSIAKALKQSIASVQADTSQSSASVRSLPPGATLRRLNYQAGLTTSLEEAVLGGPPHRDVLMCFHPTKGPVRYRSDRYGFNNPDTIYDADAIDVALFGDSFTEGICLEPGDDVAGQVRSAGFNAANFGIRGNGPLFELAAMGRYGRAFKPKTVVVLYYAGNDGSNLEQEASEAWLMAGLEDDADYGSPAWSEAQKASVDSAIPVLANTSGAASSQSYRRRLMRNFVALAQTWSVLGLHYPSLPKHQPIFLDVISKMESLAKEWDGDFILVYIPRAERFRGALPNDFVFDADRRLVIEAAKQANISLIDLAEEFGKTGDPYANFGPDGHFSEEGAKLAASLIIEEIKVARGEQIAASAAVSR